MRGFRRGAYGRTARVAVAVVAAGALTFAVTSPGSAAPGVAAQENPVGPGLGTAVALVYKVNPIFGNLSFGITAGESVAGHQNTAATAQSKAINLGVIGVTLAGEGCEGDDPTLPAEQQPQPVIVGSDDPGAAQGKTASQSGLISMSARATKQPFAEAITTIAPLGDPAAVAVSAGKSIATSGLIQGNLRQARAFSEIGRVSLFGGLLVLEDLQWEAVQETGSATTNAGSFHMGAVHLAGTSIPLPNDPLAQLAALRDVLGSLGFTITAPTTRVEQGIVFVDPLRIGIVPSQARDNLISLVLGGIQEARESFTALLAQLGCGSDTDVLGNNGKTAVTVLDLALGAVSGAGALTVELGGVKATTSEFVGFGGLGEVGPLPDLGVLPDVGLLPPVDLGGLPSGPIDLGGSPGGTGGVAAPIAEVDDGERGGILLGVAGGGLLLLLGTAEADRRKMRRAQREILQEA